MPASMPTRTVLVDMPGARGGYEDPDGGAGPLDVWMPRTAAARSAAADWLGVRVVIARMADAAGIRVVGGLQRPDQSNVTGCRQGRGGGSPESRPSSTPIH